MANVRLFSGRLCEWLKERKLPSCFLRMFPDFYLPIRAEISESFSHRWKNSGMVWRGECLTASISESPSDGVECSLSDVLEGRVHPKYFLSQKACQGILRRAEKRGKMLPTALENALRIAATKGTADSIQRLSPQPLDNRVQEAERPKRSSPSSTKSPEVGESREQTTKTISSMDEGAKSEQTNQMPQREQGERESEKEAQCSLSVQHPTEFSTLRGFGHGWQGQHWDDAAKVGMVRRLTPTECERLQGFPDGWTCLCTSVPTPPDTAHSETP